MTDDYQQLMLKVGIKYCGGCNPHYDRVAIVKRIADRLAGKVEIVALDHDQIDLVVAVEGCSTACADLTSFKDKAIRIVMQPENAEEFILQILD